ncbi:MAG: nuclease-related domain-containing protein [Fibrobacteraceae bacterium]|nr:nuclease-related domain-containing protein [Fibrobacteraceae bacterium]
MVIFWWLIFIMLIFIILMKMFQNQIVGYIGEKYTAGNIKSISKGYVIRDIYVNGSYGVQQIDIVAITSKGILVIEKKTYIGLIVGSEYDRQWKIFVARGRRKYSMKNPHHQNFGHIQAILENFPTMKDLCISVVVFGNNAKLGDRIPANTIRDIDFKTFYNNLPNILTQQQMSEFAEQIQSFESKRVEYKKMHKEKIKAKR